MSAWDEARRDDASTLPAMVAEALRSGRRPTDRLFDRCMPEDVRAVSGQYWTPLAVAMRVAEWLREEGVTSVVDIGSGAGKLCVAAALATTARFWGIEQRGRLVEAARSLAASLGVDDRVAFVHGSFREVDLPTPDAYYLYNPFGENRFDASERLDHDVELSEARYRADVDAVGRILRDAPVGTYLVTYNGFGGTIPSTYEERRVDRSGIVLRMWRKTDRRRLRLPFTQA